MRVSLVPAARAVALICLVSTTALAGNGWRAVRGKAGLQADSGVRFFRFVPGPLKFSAFGLSSPMAGSTACLKSVSVLNPDWERVEAVRLYWNVYEEADLDTPISTGVSSLVTFAKPLWFKDSDTMHLELVIPGLRDDSAYRLEVGVDTILYERGGTWSRPRTTEHPAPAPRLETQPN